MTKIIIALILSGISIFIIFAYVKPTYNDTKTILATTAQYDKALAKAREIQSLRQSLLSEYNLFSDANRKKLKKLLPDDVDNVRLILDIDGIATTRGIRIGSVKVDKKNKKSSSAAQTDSAIGFASAETESQKYETIILRFTATAPYEEFKLFLRDLEQSLRIVDLVELKITQASTQRDSAGNSIGPALYKFDVGIKTYWLK